MYIIMCYDAGSHDTVGTYILYRIFFFKSELTFNSKNVRRFKIVKNKISKLAFLYEKCLPFQNDDE